MKKRRTVLKQFILDKAGQGLLEYGLAIGLVAIVAVASLTLLGPKVAASFSNASGAFDGQLNSSQTTGSQSQTQGNQGHGSNGNHYGQGNQGGNGLPGNGKH